MTSLAGEFQTDLPPEDAVVACADAIDGLGWEIDTVEADRIVSHANGSSSNPALIEVDLDGSDQGTEIRIVGSDTEAQPLSQEALIEELNRARDAIQASVEQAQDEEESQVTSAADTSEAASAGPPAGWYQNPDGPGNRWWDGARWTEHQRAAATAPSDSRKAPGSSPSPEPSSAVGGQPRAFWIAAGASLLLAIGSLGPWAILGVFSVSGTAGDGVLTIILAIIAGLTLWAFSSRATSVRAWIVMICGVLAAAVGIYDAATIGSTEFLGETGVVQVGWGLWMVCAASIVVAVAAFSLARLAKRIPADSGSVRQ